MIEKKYLNRWVKDGYISMPIFSKKEVEEMKKKLDKDAEEKKKHELK